MKYFLIGLCLFLLNCEKIEINGSSINSAAERSSTIPGQASESLLKSADKFNSVISLSNIDQEKFREWKNLYLSSSPILSSIDVENIQLSLNLDLSETSGNFDTYSGNLSFKFHSNQEKFVIEKAYTGQGAEEIKYNYVYAYNNAEGVVRYAWKAFFESKYGAFLVVLKEGIVNANNKVVFSMSNGVLYYRHWGLREGRGMSRDLVELGNNPKCWLKQGPWHYNVESRRRGFFDCRTWRSSFLKGIDITRNLEPDEFYEHKYTQMVRKTISNNFHHNLYLPPPMSSIYTWTNGNRDSVIGVLVKNKDKSYEEIYNAFSGFLINSDFKYLISAIPIKLAGKSLSELQNLIILNTYRRLVRENTYQLEQWDSDSVSSRLPSQIRAMRKEMLKINLQLIGTEYEDEGLPAHSSDNSGNRGDNSGNRGADYKKLAAATLSKSMGRVIPLWETSYIKLADFSSSDVKIAFKLSRVANVAFSKNRKPLRGLSSGVNAQRGLSSVKNQKNVKPLYKLLFISLGLLLIIFIGFVIQKKRGVK